MGDMTRVALASLLLLALASACGEEAEDPCAVPRPPPSLELGRANIDIDFCPINLDQGYAFELGPSGVWMFNDVAVRVRGLVPPLRSHGFATLAVQIDGEAFGEDQSHWSASVRAGPDEGCFEVVGMQVVEFRLDYPSALDVFGKQVNFDVQVQGACGNEAAGSWELPAISSDSDPCLHRRHEDPSR